MTISLLYIPAPDMSKAKKIALVLLEEKLIACANILPGITSLYQWKGEIQESTEVILIAKTTPELVDKTMERAKHIHSYECPCIAIIPIDKVNEDFVKWIEDEVR